jgi:hypothetical protein
MMDTKLPKIEVLKMILGRYHSQRRLEEAVIVQRLIDKELSKPEKYGHGLYQDNKTISKPVSYIHRVCEKDGSPVSLLH